MRRTIIFLTSMCTAVLLACGIALAADFPCGGGSCDGTTGDHTMTGSTSADQMYGIGANDTMYGGDGADAMWGD